MHTEAARSHEQLYDAEATVGPPRPWIAWLLGAALLAAVIGAALHVSEGRAFARLLEQASPGWLLLAFALQAATYLAQAEIFRIAPHAAGAVLSRAFLYQLSLAKVFLDQALPPAGISSAAVAAKALQQRGVARGPVAAGAIINIASYDAAYVVTSCSRYRSPPGSASCIRLCWGCQPCSWWAPAPSRLRRSRCQVGALQAPPQCTASRSSRVSSRFSGTRTLP
jgi:hypothetical protein